MPVSIGVDQALATSESASRGEAEGPGVLREPKMGWHYTFFVLAAIGISAITASLSFSRALTEDFAEAVTTNYEWVEREALYSELVKLSGECARPAISILKSRDVGAERIRLTENLSLFRDRLDIARREARVNLPVEKRKALEKQIDLIAAGMDQTENQVRGILELYQRDGFEPHSSGPMMAQLNETTSAVGKSIVDLYRHIREDQGLRFESQLREAEQLRTTQSWFLFGILGMVVVVALYGNRLSRASRSAIATIAAQARGLADREARLRTIFNTAAEGIITINEHGIVESCNQATLDLFQQPADQIVGTPLHSLFEQQVTGEPHRRTARIRDVDSLLGTRQELIAYRPDGSQMVVDFAAAEVRFDDHRVITGILHDITERKQFVTQLQQARCVAESATRARTQFLANMSHEIRTPMTSIIGYAELLSNPEQTAHDRFRCVEIIRSNADHLLALINDILDLSRIEAGQMTIEKTRCCPAQIVNEVVALMQCRAAARDLHMEVVFDSPIPEFIHSDAVRLRQILINLTGNAVKFTFEGSVKIHVRFDDQDESSPRLIFRVVDTGIGISASQQSRLFRPFTQIDSSTTRSFGGSGLGLSISKRLVEFLGGAISLSSAEGLGSTFEFSIETGAVSGEMISSPDIVRSVPKRAPTRISDPVSAEVLLAEDGEDNRRLLEYHLTRAGATVTCVDNGQKAVREALSPESSFDLILMDMQMPVMDGYSATGKLRESGYQGRIVALTAHAMSGDRERCLKAGCDDFLAKPVDAVKLIDTVREATNGNPVGPPPATGPRPQGENSGLASKGPSPQRKSDPIISLYADDRDMAGIVRNFVSGLPARLKTLEAAAADGDLQKIAALAHDLKGTGGGFGFPAISEAAEAVEKAARSKGAETQECSLQLKELQSVCERAMAGLEEGNDCCPLLPIPSEESIPPGPDTPDDVLAQIEKLASSDPENLDVSDVLENLTRILRQSPPKHHESPSSNVNLAMNSGAAD